MLGPERGGVPDHLLPSTQVQTFHGDLLQHMEKNTKLDMQFIKVSLAAASSRLTHGTEATFPAEPPALSSALTHGPDVQSS